MLHAELWYLWGIPWDGAFVAAIVAAVVSGLAWFFQSMKLDAQARQAERFQAQSHGFLKYTTAVGYLESKSTHTKREGIRILTTTKDAKWLTDEDRELIQGALADAVDLVVEGSGGKR